MLFAWYTVTSRDVNFRYPDRVMQTEFCHGWPLVISDTDGKFAASVVDTSGKMPPASLTPVANLPPVSLTPVSLVLVANLPPISTTLAELVAKFTASVIDTGGAPSLVNVSTYFRKKFEMTLVLFSVAWGKMIHEKKLKQKSRDTVPLNLTLPNAPLDSRCLFASYP
jgi:hypothetical protein